MTKNQFGRISLIAWGQDRNREKAPHKTCSDFYAEAGALCELARKIGIWVHGNLMLPQIVLMKIFFRVHNDVLPAALANSVMSKGAMQ